MQGSTVLQICNFPRVELKCSPLKVNVRGDGCLIGWEEFFHKYTVANHHVVDFKYLKMLLVSYISIKLFKRIECLSDVRVGF